MSNKEKTNNKINPIHPVEKLVLVPCDQVIKTLDEQTKINYFAALLDNTSKQRTYKIPYKQDKELMELVKHFYQGIYYIAISKIEDDAVRKKYGSDKDLNFVNVDDFMKMASQLVNDKRSLPEIRISIEDWLIKLYSQAIKSSNSQNYSTNTKANISLNLIYKDLIAHIMKRNPLYKLRELNLNEVEITNTGMSFSLRKINDVLKITWYWDSFSSGKNHVVEWQFHESENQDLMYQKISNDMTIQNLIDEGMTKIQAIEWVKIINTTDEEESEKLVEIFSKKHPSLWAKITS
ncbi:hypothetical protein G6R40_09645 [Chryseobacterium sp. POL2]|uniref:hypothetical protein n=1 Tax=Chryseobacterium sp. POL2 TaxID=2713414 RepID=UPI0013E1BEA0|nr:hypothetical protein [Chryseobacterium sp. POL2]QIG89907.1 hypothetical protein G6R40_09645 [Chryseobacterium sp. POL2]